MKIEIKVVNKEFYKDNTLPQYQTKGSAAVDLISTESFSLHSGECRMIPTGIAVWVGELDNTLSVAGLIIPRSGLGSKGLILGNTVGLIDEDYQGELKICAWNRQDSCVDHVINIKAGDRIAQMLFMPVIKAEWHIVEEFSNETYRGNRGFGSTGGF